MSDIRSASAVDHRDGTYFKCEEFRLMEKHNAITFADNMTLCSCH